MAGLDSLVVDAAKGLLHRGQPTLRTAAIIQFVSGGLLVGLLAKGMFVFAVHGRSPNHVAMIAKISDSPASQLLPQPAAPTACSRRRR